MAFVIVRRARPCPGYEVNGDGIIVRARETDTLFAVVDGVGHGKQAAEATEALLAYLGSTQAEELESVLKGADRAAATTRGAALSLVQMQHGSTTLSYLGVGNVNARLWTPDQHSVTLVNHNGIVGRLRKIPPPWTYQTEDHQLLILHSDGISSRKVYEEMEEWDGDLEAQADRIMTHATHRDDASLLLVQIRHDN
ncbi:MAG: protein phosphatase 2C family protein [Chloroflexota bacterium]|nr:protein phosphatase 2C family protein [Chloroflexota bacterium]